MQISPIAMEIALEKARVGKAIPKERATPSAGNDRSAPKQQTPTKYQRILGLPSRINKRTNPIKNITQLTPMRLSADRIHLEPPGNQDDAIAPRTRLIADNLNSGESAFGTRKCQSP